jgi:oxygen-independent coproporphyrinogen-3 oxidase
VRPELVKRFAAPVPRYTSYPTAPHFSDRVGPGTYQTWLSALPDGVRLSLYVHIPFCGSLCWYCGCHTKEVRRYAPVAAYLRPLRAEIANIARRAPAAHEVTHIHWGGGSPNILSPDDIELLADTQRRHFRLSDGIEFAVEIDPRGFDDNRLTAFARAGVTRVSIGVQDFDSKVQVAINRRQSFDETRRAVAAFRSHGIDSINIDLVYGLPHQTRASLEDTVRQVVELRPSRIAAFGYAHLPSRLRHQTLIDTAALPGPVERFAQASRLARVLTRAGYKRVGLDHYALDGDPLVSSKLVRNFQGYTTDRADALIGLGASAIGQLPQGYVQNCASTPEYERKIAEGALATARGISLTEADRMRAFVIERLLCDLAFPERELLLRYGDNAEELLREAQALLAADQDFFIEREGDTFRVTERGRPFVRSIAACFDAYFDPSAMYHTSGI